MNQLSANDDDCCNNQTTLRGERARASETLLHNGPDTPGLPQQGLVSDDPTQWENESETNNNNKPIIPQEPSVEITRDGRNEDKKKNVEIKPDGGQDTENKAGQKTVELQRQSNDSPPSIYIQRPSSLVKKDEERDADEEEHNVHFDDYGDRNEIHIIDENADSDSESDSGNGSGTIHEYFTQEPPDGGYGWVIVMCAFLHQLIADGLLFSFGIIYVDLLDHFKSGKSETSWVGAALMGTSMITGPIVGAVASRYSLRTAGIAGSLIAAAGLFASYFAPSILILTFTYGIISGTGIGFMFLTSILACNVYFRKRRALANGIAMCGSGVGVFTLSPILVYLIDYFGWQGTMMCLSGFALNGCVVAALYRPVPPTRHTGTFILPDHTSDSGIEPTEEADDDEEELEHEESLMDKSSIVNKHLNVARLWDDKSSIASDRTKTPTGSARNLKSSNFRLDASSHSLYRSGYWDQIQPVQQLSHLDICQIGSMLTIPTVHSMKESGLTHSRSAMTIEEKESYLFWRYNNYECSSAMSALCRNLSCHLLRRPTMLLLVIAGMLWTGQSTTYMFIVDYAYSIGVSDAKGAFLLSAIGITNCIGRVVVGLVTDSPRINSTLVYLISIAIAGAANILIPFIDNYALLMCLAVVFGLSMASYVSLRSIVCVDNLGIDNLAGALGLVVMFQGFAFTFVPPISGAILEATLTFKGPFVASGACYLLSACVMIPIFVQSYRRSRADHFL